MLPLEVSQNKSRIDALIALMDSAIPNVEIRLQNVFSSHLVILASGHVEISVRAIIGSFVTRRANRNINGFVIKTLERENSLNCEKVSKIIDKFDDEWKPKLFAKITIAEREAIDSLKTLRDQIAHGRLNGTGYITVKGYFVESCRYLAKLDDVVSSY